MPVHPEERKLAAIFAADIAGYSRLMARDEMTDTLTERRFAFWLARWPTMDAASGATRRAFYRWRHLRPFVPPYWLIAACAEFRSAVCRRLQQRQS